MKGSEMKNETRTNEETKLNPADFLIPLVNSDNDEKRLKMILEDLENIKSSGIEEKEC